MSSVLHYPHLGIFILAWFIVDLLTPLLMSAAHRLRILDRPGGHKAQERPVPFFGGVGVFVGFTISLCSTLRFASVESFTPLFVLLLGGAVVVTLGLLDDFRPINAIAKLAVLFVITAALAAAGISLELFPVVLHDLPNVLITLLWIVGVTSAMNSLDNSDGVVGGVSTIAAAFIFGIAWGSSAADAQPWLSYLALAAAGSCLGFLRYNWSPARIYLGDNGSFFLGYALATMLVFGHYSTDPLQAILVPCLILTVPIFDITVTTVLRFRDGQVRTWRQAVTYCGRDHTAHILMGIGLSQRQAAMCLYALGLLGGSTALLVLSTTRPELYLTITGIYVAMVLWMAIILGRLKSRALGESYYLPHVPPRSSVASAPVASESAGNQPRPVPQQS